MAGAAGAVMHSGRRMLDDNVVRISGEVLRFCMASSKVTKAKSFLTCVRLQLRNGIHIAWRAHATTDDD